MERVVKLGAEVFVEVAGYRQVETAQRIFFAKHVVDYRIVCVVSEVIKIQR